MDTAHYILQHTFGYSAFRGQQADIIQALLAGEDALVVMPTGGGKSSAIKYPPWRARRRGGGIALNRPNARPGISPARPGR